MLSCLRGSSRSSCLTRPAGARMRWRDSSERRCRARWVRTVIVENVVGAGGTIANDRVARSTPDGTTILINHTALLSAPSLFSNLRYDTRTAFEPIGLVNIAPLLLVGRKTIPGSGPKDFVAWMKEQGAKMTFAHGGIGTNTQLCAVLIGNVLGFRPVFAAYRGSAPALADLVAGQIDLICDQATSALPQVQAGLLHGIAVTSTARLEQAPDIPTAAEVGLSNLVYTFWHGLYVPKGTSNGCRAQCGAAGCRARSRSPRKAQGDRDGAVPRRPDEPRGPRGSLRRGPGPHHQAGRKLRPEAERGEVGGAEPADGALCCRCSEVRVGRKRTRTQPEVARPLAWRRAPGSRGD